jgi:hypothetical protein
MKSSSETNSRYEQPYAIFNESNIYILVIALVVIVVYYILFSSLGGGETDGYNDSESGSSFLQTILWSVFIILILLNGMQYFFNINIISSIQNLFSGTPTIDLKVETSNLKKKEEPKYVKPVPQEEVFHIPGNVYTYDEGKAVCKAYGARLANYKEVENAYQKGGDWCSYGWSDNQSIYFPTQHAKWDKLQKIKGHENDCGRPGVNGGYMEDPELKFGVNCFGYKPKMRKEEEALLHGNIFPKTEEELQFDKKVEDLKHKLPEIMVAPFNNEKWSAIY